MLWRNGAQRAPDALEIDLPIEPGTGRGPTALTTAQLYGIEYRALRRWPRVRAGMVKCRHRLISETLLSGREGGLASVGILVDLSTLWCHARA